MLGYRTSNKDIPSPDPSGGGVKLAIRRGEKTPTPTRASENSGVEDGELEGTGVLVHVRGAAADDLLLDHVLRDTRDPAPLQR